MVETGEFRDQGEGKGSQPELVLLFQSAGLVAVCKPAGYSTAEMLQLLSAKLKHTVTQVSRLDKPTSGVLVAAVGSAASSQAWWLLAQFAGRLVSKSYLCLCFGQPSASEGEISSPLQTTHSPHGYSHTEARAYQIHSAVLAPVFVAAYSDSTRTWHRAYLRCRPLA